MSKEFSYDTMLADELLGQKTFNAGSSSQGMASSYYLLKEICEYHDIKEVYLEQLNAINEKRVQLIEQASARVVNSSTIPYKAPVARK